MATAHDVAARIIEQQHEQGRTVDKLQLQKLLYIVNGAHVLTHGTLGLRCDFRAYRNGPVVEQVEGSYRQTVEGDGPIESAVGGRPERVGEDLSETIDVVLRIFGSWTGPNLERYVKRDGSPYWQAWEGQSRDGRGRNVISPSAIAQWFATRPLDPNERWDDEPLTVHESAEDFRRALS